MTLTTDLGHGIVSSRHPERPPHVPDLLGPKNDDVFTRVFGEAPDLLVVLISATLRVIATISRSRCAAMAPGDRKRCTIRPDC
ncbi:hypothetical protein Thivi_4539 [Thiocystis violascens DSM 198]|uniref:Uncharacterized protein n=1 Tax=Thiocystis violascens (strain ATCC 17096 / DSM 198 / 6111) TaxID=765911 RepID=I3YH65_THIV6|nr:hypothetical protein Thivi_4539 [Thiocystis violascens DSM 198]